MNAILEIRDLRKAYPGFTLDNVSFSLPAGHVMGMIGPNGAGKTTIIKLILNLVRKDAGEIRVFGLDHERCENRIKDRIGFVHEVPPFYDHLSAGAFGALVAPFYSRWNHARFKGLVSDFELPLGKRIRTFSRGMKMKLAIAIALSHDADLLVMDEPTSGLDPVFRRELLDHLYGILQHEDKSILFSTHITTDLERIVDYVTLIQNGKVRFSESRENVKERWRIVKAGRDVLTEEVRGLLSSLRVSEYGFTALTSNPGKVRELVGKEAVFEQASLDDLVSCANMGESHG